MDRASVSDLLHLVLLPDVPFVLLLVRNAARPLFASIMESLLTEDVVQIELEIFPSMLYHLKTVFDHKL